jgi:hypothetical protein
MPEQDHNPFAGLTGLQVAEALGLDLRAPTKQTRVPSFDDVSDTVRELLQDMELDAAPEPAGPWPDRVVWPATRRLFALWRFEREGNTSAYDNTRASLVERGVL